MNDVNYEMALQAGPPIEAGSEPLPCDRCGSFARLYWSWGRRLCPACLDRQHPTLAGGRGIGRLVADSVRLLPGFGSAGVLIALAPFPFVVVMRALRPLPDTGNERVDTLQDLGPTAFSGVLSGFVTAVLTAVLLQIVLGSGRADYRAALRAVARRAIAVIGLSLGLTLAAELGTLLFRYLSYIVFGVASTMAYPILLHERVNPLEAFFRSAYRLKGQYLRLLAVTLLLGLPIAMFMLVAIVADAVAEVPQLLSPATLVEGLYGLIGLPFVTLSVVLYVKQPPKMILPEPVHATVPEPGASAHP